MLVSGEVHCACIWDQMAARTPWILCGWLLAPWTRTPQGHRAPMEICLFPCSGGLWVGIRVSSPARWPCGLPGSPSIGKVRHSVPLLLGSGTGTGGGPPWNDVVSSYGLVDQDILDGLVLPPLGDHDGVIHPHHGSTHHGRHGVLAVGQLLILEIGEDVKRKLLIFVIWRKSLNFFFRRKSNVEKKTRKFMVRDLRFFCDATYTKKNKLHNIRFKKKSELRIFRYASYFFF